LSTEVAKGSYFLTKVVKSILTTACPKKGTSSILGTTSLLNRPTDQFSIFFHFYNLLEICNKAVVKYPITPKTRHYTTL